MKKLNSFLFAITLIAVSLTSTAQDSWQGAERAFAVKLGTTKPVRDVLPRNPTEAYKHEVWKKSKPEFVRNFTGRRQEPIVREGALPYGPDPLHAQVETRDAAIVILPSVNVEGINRQQSGSGVPDPNGDVSDQYYLQTVNSTLLQVYDLNGNKIGQPFLANTIWQQVGFSSAGDPIVLFDNEAGRWFLTEFPSSNRVLIAVSDTGDPLGSWTAYAFSTPRFPDYPKYGIWSNAYVLSTNEGGGGTLKFYAIDRHAILNGESDVTVQRFTIPRLPNPSWQTLQPVDWNGHLGPAEHTHPMVMRINDDAFGGSPVDQIEIFEIIVDWDDQNNSQVVKHEIPVSPFDSEFCSAPGSGFACVPQPGGAAGIDGIPYIFMNACQYRNFGTHSSIVGNFTVDVTGNDHGGVRWIELRKVEDGPWELYQEGTVGSNDGLNRFMGGISIDSKGNIGLAYSVSGTAYFPSLRYTGRRASDPLGKMTVQEHEFAKGGGTVNTDRFGDYASMSVDPDDMFWYTGEYVPAGGQWSTKIVGFKITRDTFDVGPFKLMQPGDAPDLAMEQVTACFINHGIEAVTKFEAGFIAPDGQVHIETIEIDSLLTDSLYCHTFSAFIDLSEFGPHTVTIFTSMQLDSAVLNDTCRYSVIHQTRWDASVPRLDNVPLTLCDTFISLDFVLQNIGVNDLTEVLITWSLNGGEAHEIAWSGNLSKDETINIPVDIAGLIPGDNSVLVYTSSPNGLDDQNPLNDTLEARIFATPGGQQTTLVLLTDNFPQETSWKLLDEDNNVLLEGGPFGLSQAEYIEQWCLDTSRCYKFVLLDSWGDGIQGQGVNGFFQIINGEGIIVAALNNPDFGFSDTTAFCLQSNCNLTANVFVKHETRPDGQNGTINVFASGGVPPLQFSVNGGATYQSGTFFNNLAPGSYNVVARDATGCFYTRLVHILDCDIQAIVDVTQATGAMQADGAILINAVGGNGPLQYSINGGSFQMNTQFSNLLPDTFNIVIRDSVDCRVSFEVIVDFASSVRNIRYGNMVNVFPNPSTGYFDFEIHGLPSGTVQVTYDILDATGRVVLQSFASSYNDVVKGAFSLLNQPPGTYYMRFRHKDLGRLIQIVRIQ